SAPFPPIALRSIPRLQPTNPPRDQSPPRHRRERVLTLRAQEFLRRFLQHVLPKGFRRVRTYGWLSPAAKNRFATVGALLDTAAPSKPSRPALVMAISCPHCQKPMRRIAQFGRAPPHHATSSPA